MAKGLLSCIVYQGNAGPALTTLTQHHPLRAQVLGERGSPVHAAFEEAFLRLLRALLRDAPPELVSQVGAMKQVHQVEVSGHPMISWDLTHLRHLWPRT